MQKQVVLESDLIKCGVPKKIMSCRKGDLPFHLKHHLDMSFSYLVDGSNVMLYGEDSIERAKMCVVLLKRLIAKAKNPEAAQICLYEPVVLDAYAGYSFDDNPESTEIWFRMIEPEYLILACMDGRCISRKLYGQCYSTLLSHRLTKNKPTMMTTSLSQEELETFYGSEVVKMVEGYFENVTAD